MPGTRSKDRFAGCIAESIKLSARRKIPPGSRSSIARERSATAKSGAFADTRTPTPRRGRKAGSGAAPWPQCISANSVELITIGSMPNDKPNKPNGTPSGPMAGGSSISSSADSGSSLSDSMPRASRNSIFSSHPCSSTRKKNSSNTGATTTADAAATIHIATSFFS